MKCLKTNLFYTDRAYLFDLYNMTDVCKMQIHCFYSNTAKLHHSTRQNKWHFKTAALPLLSA